MAFNITVEGQKIMFLDEDKNILNALERKNIDSQFHCRDGFCGTCRCLLKKGTVEYAQFPLAFIGDNEILTCCSTPTSDIEIDIHG
ncbi:2Fe-2S ferredoxin-like protein [Colwellia sp. MB3u-70]|uniref:class I ribonucleotide reductase maintenance protein YfaE n=1 Tax=unclassified Colwellia TaxID=196834 RepID=UPI0015F45C9D|nr:MULTISPECIES: class I ribonucleotide reductase maintenance protein YfaE [unclassified Colwellia]MBA6291191.1 2Fe-2S ferredoxin-like protein [Colwellia sp. MB3u-8]MBA6305916.1 2Fe-2S ferredoxin-like protein [Colwellia sp. MB3u-70]